MWVWEFGCELNMLLLLLFSLVSFLKVVIRFWVFILCFFSSL